MQNLNNLTNLNVNPVKPEHREYLNNLNEWLEPTDPAVVAQHLKNDFPALTIEEARVIVDHWWAGKPRLLNEGYGDSYTGC